MQFYGYTIDKTYMFLICNGLLLLIAINSVTLPTTKTESEFRQQHHLIVSVNPTYCSRSISTLVNQQIKNLLRSGTGNQTGHNASSPPTMELAEKSTHLEVDVSAPIASESDESPQGEKSSMIIEQENVLSLSDTVEYEEDGSAIVVLDDDDDDAEAAEELNKKCEEFIKRMKAALKHESKQEWLVPAE
ncbi:hypothetical protein RJT34_10640 [Clitoria ternatea]|uniref:Uncharacterized protein n=1 Tax=Clitoria ternatea TaxID=43366 RepID=A0AAN9JKV1_CLITE